MELMSLAGTLWKEWGHRLMVLLSLLIQISLTLITCSRRKRFHSSTLRFLLWLSYSSADAIAVSALSIISHRLAALSEEGPIDESRRLIALWAPILLLFLGGPDSMSALALEDNELWKRHLLGVVAQTSAAIYIMVMACANSYLSYLSLVMLLVAILKCGEKTWALWGASSDSFRKWLHSGHTAKYDNFIEEYRPRREEGYIVRFEETLEVYEDARLSIDHCLPVGCHSAHICRAHALFPTFVRLFADLILSESEKIASIAIFEPLELASDAFRIVEIELHFIYLLLHTKAKWLYTPRGVGFRLATTLSALTVLTAFFVISQEKRKHYFEIDRVLTILLLAALTLQEFYSLFVLWFSYSANDWRRTGESSVLTRMAPPLGRSIEPRGPVIMCQFCLVGYCIKADTWPTLSWLLDLVNYDRSWHTSHEDISYSLKDFIYSFLKKRMEDPERKPRIGEWSPGTASEVLSFRDDHYKHWCWSMNLEFDHCILVWHIATELCCHKEETISDSKLEGSKQLSLHLKMSKLISRYMVYLLVDCPFMMPAGISHVRIRDTVAHAEIFSKSGISALSDAYKELLHMPKVNPGIVKGSVSKSVLLEGQWLAWQLIEEGPTWERMAEVWLHFLLCAAKQSTGASHAKQLCRGGELLTQVWMLMAHLGLTDHFQRQSQVITGVVYK